MAGPDRLRRSTEAFTSWSERLVLQFWTVYVTSADGESLSVVEVELLYPARCQVELLFELLRSEHEQSRLRFAVRLSRRKGSA